MGAISRLLLALLVPATIALGVGRLADNPNLATAMTAAFALFVWGCRKLSLRGHVALASHIFLFGSFCLVMVSVYLFGGVTGPNVSTMPIVVLYAGLLRGSRTALIYTIAMAVLLCVIGVATFEGWLPPPPMRATIEASVLVVTLNLATAAIMLSLSNRQRKDAQAVAERAALVAESNHERLEQLIAESPDGLAWFDSRGRIMAANPEFCRLCARSPEHLAGQTVSEIARFTSESRVEALRAIERLASGEPERRFVLRGESTSECFVEVNAKRVVLQDGMEAFQWIARDVSGRESEREARERLAAELREARHLEDIGRLAGGVAHDFNNLLTAVNANAHLLVKDNSLPERAKKQLDVITQAGERAAALTQQLLAFARRQVLAPQPMDLREAVEGMATLLQEMLGQGIRLELELGETPVWVEADRSRFEQVISNLAVNGRDAMPDGGTLTIRLRRVSLEAHPVLAPGPYALLHVRDTGAGMDDATAARVFEPFFTTKPEAKGTGLGLATVHGIVRQSGGHIAVDSKPDQGATFEVFLPEIEAPPPVRVSEPEDAPVASVGVGGVVLVVDDEPLVRQTVESVLELSGFEVLSAGGPEEAARLMGLRECPLDLLVTDVVMPGESGPQLACRLKSRWPSLRVIFMSGYADDMNTGRWHVVPPSHYLQKPFTPGALRALVAEVMASPVAAGLLHGSFDSES